MNFEPLAEMIEESVAGLKRGSTLFINQMPTECEFGVLLKNSYSGIDIDPELTGRRRGKFNVIARGRGYTAVKEMIEQVMDTLTLRETTVTGMRIWTMRPLTEPISYQLNAANLFEFSVTFSVIYDKVAG